jgi:hypothetical protein
MSAPAGAQTEGSTTLVEDIDGLVADVLAAAKAPSLTSILVVVQQVVGFIVFYGILSAGQAAEVMAIINAGIGAVVLVIHAVHQNAAHKTVNGVVQAKLDLIASGYPDAPGSIFTPSEPGAPTALAGRLGGHTRG